jgi:hypothetical protein
VLALAGPLAFVVRLRRSDPRPGAHLAKGIFICGDLVLCSAPLPLAG